ncbi:histidine phosphatase family protein [Mycobacterium sp.]|uniref:histidine phosphatase family protein n=1 Tax=Mycobacterium sp. TaxID=1785 RepID=UPI0031D64568
MPDLSQQRSRRRLLRKPCRYGAAGLLSTVLLVIGSAPAWADESIMLDFVRHAQTTNNVPGTLQTVPPGYPLTDEGHSQAQALADVLAAENVHGTYASQFIEDQQTAEPLAHMLGLNVPILPGLNDIPGGIVNGLGVNDYSVVNDLIGAYYIVGPFAWTLGLYFVPELGDPGFNGATFEDLFGGAVQTMYDTSVANGGGNVTDAAFAAEASIAIWALMNVNNPDFPLIFGESLRTGDFLPYTGVAVVQGEPGDWTLVSWNGQPVPPASLPTELFVDVRDVITPPQLAAYNIFEALLTGDPTTIVNALQVGVGDVVAATAHFPVAVITDIVNAVRDAIPNAAAGVLDLDALPGDLSTGLATLLPATAAGLSGDVGTLVSEALTSW